MATWSGTDLSAGPPNYDRLSSGAGKPSQVVSDSPHESDDDEVSLLKHELRRLRERNLNAFHQSLFVAAPTQPPVATAVQFTAQGPVYQHPVVTNAVPTATPISTNGSNNSNDSSATSCVKCILICVVTFVVIVILLVIIL